MHDNLDDIGHDLTTMFYSVAAFTTVLLVTVVLCESPPFIYLHDHAPLPPHRRYQSPLHRELPWKNKTIKKRASPQTRQSAVGRQATNISAVQGAFAHDKLPRETNHSRSVIINHEKRQLNPIRPAPYNIRQKATPNSFIITNVRVDDFHLKLH